MTTVEVSISDYAQLGTLHEFFRQAIPGLDIRRTAGMPRPGEQGSLDLLTVVADSTVLTAALNLVPILLRSRKAGTKVKARRGKKEVEIDGHLSDEQVKRMIDWFLDD